MAMKQLKTRMFGGVRVACDVETGRVIGSRTARTSGLFLIPADGQVDNPPRLPVAEPAAARTGRSAVLWGTLSCSRSASLGQRFRPIRTAVPCDASHALVSGRSRAESGDPVAALPTAPLSKPACIRNWPGRQALAFRLAVSATISSPGHRPSINPVHRAASSRPPCHDPGRTLDIALRVTGCGMDREQVNHDLGRDHDLGSAGAGGRPARLRRAGPPVRADGLRPGAGAPAPAGRRPGADAGSLRPRPRQARPAPRPALLRRLAPPDHGPPGHQPPDPACAAALHGVGGAGAGPGRG